MGRPQLGSKPKGPRSGSAGARCEAREPGPAKASFIPPGCANEVEDRSGIARAGKPRCRSMDVRFPQVLDANEAEDRSPGRPLGPACETENGKAIASQVVRRSPAACYSGVAVAMQIRGNAAAGLDSRLMCALLGSAAANDEGRLKLPDGTAIDPVVAPELGFLIEQRWLAEDGTGTWTVTAAGRFWFQCIGYFDTVKFHEHGGAVFLLHVISSGSETVVWHKGRFATISIEFMPQPEHFEVRRENEPTTTSGGVDMREALAVACDLLAENLEVPPPRLFIPSRPRREGLERVLRPRSARRHRHPELHLGCRRLSRRPPGCPPVRRPGIHCPTRRPLKSRTWREPGTAARSNGPRDRAPASGSPGADV